MRLRVLMAAAAVAGLATPLMGVVSAGAGPSGGGMSFCKAVVNINLVFNTLEEDEPTAAQERRIGKLLTRIEANPPAELAEPVDTVVETVSEGEGSDFESDEFRAANELIDQWVIDNCGYNVVQVTGRDYAFEGIPEALPPGVTVFEFTNEGVELHELSVVRLKGDVSLPQLFELPEDEAEDKVVVAGTTFSDPGETSPLYTRLKKGRYGALCFLPVGSTSEEAIETADGLPPHALEGMATEFEAGR